MMRIAENNIIVGSPGDTFIYPLFINLGTKLDPQPYALKADDKVCFSIMKPHQSFEEGVVRKIFDINNIDEDGNVEIYISSEDTEWLCPDTYYYEIKLFMDNGEMSDPAVFTIMPKRKFYLTNQTTYF